MTDQPEKKEVDALMSHISEADLKEVDAMPGAGDPDAPKATLEAFINDQKPLDPDAARILHENKESLYMTSDAPKAMGEGPDRTEKGGDDMVRVTLDIQKYGRYFYINGGVRCLHEYDCSCTSDLLETVLKARGWAEPKEAERLRKVESYRLEDKKSFDILREQRREMEKELSALKEKVKLADEMAQALRSIEHGCWDSATCQRIASGYSERYAKAESGKS